MITRRDFTKLASITAGSLFVSPGDEWQELEARGAGNPAIVTSGFVQNAGAEIYYERTGSGPAIVFAHGMAGNHLSWWQQVPHFSSRYTCVTFAHRGFFPSRLTSGSVDPGLFEEDLVALVDQLKLAEVRLVAQSLGGLACLGFALHHPQRVRGLVMDSIEGIDQNTLDAADRKTIQSWYAAHGGMAADLRKRGIDPPAGERMAREQPALEFLYSEIGRLSASLDRVSLRQKLHAARTIPASVVKELKVPVLFITGMEDVVDPPPAAAALANLVPGARLESVTDAGHSVYFERPEIFNRLVCDFFEIHQGRTPGASSSILAE